MATENAPRVIVIRNNGESAFLTNAIMMEFAIDALKKVEAPEEVIAKAEQHFATLTKKSSAPKTESKAAKENAALAHQVAMVMPEGEAVLTSWIMSHVNGIMTPQKCTKVMQILIDKGRVEKVEKVKGRYVGYKLV